MRKSKSPTYPFLGGPPATIYLKASLKKIQYIIILLLPSFFNLREEPKTNQRLQVRNLTTLYLDGVRGFFSVLVFVRHFLRPWVKDLDTGYGQPRDDQAVQNYFLKLPGIRLLYSGPTVPIFFIVSGFVMAQKPLIFIHQGDYTALTDTTISTVFRRGPRLFLPPILTSLFVALAVQLGLYGTSYETMPAIIPQHPPKMHCLIAQLGDWTRFVLTELTQPWKWDYIPMEYDSHLWTISIQFRGSMILALVLLGSAKLNTRTRSATCGLLWAYSMYHRRWDVGLFLSGMLLSERNVLKFRENVAITPIPTRNFTLAQRAFMRAKQSMFLLMLLIGIYLCSYPRSPGSGKYTPGFMWMANMVDGSRFWHSCGVVLIIWAMDNTEIIQKIFTLGVFRYLGKISFSLYLIHGPALHIFGYSLVPRFVGMTTGDMQSDVWLGTMLAFLVVCPLVIWIADVFWRLVDQPCARLTAYIESVCFQ